FKILEPQMNEFVELEEDCSLKRFFASILTDIREIEKLKKDYPLNCYDPIGLSIYGYLQVFNARKEKRNLSIEEIEKIASNISKIDINTPEKIFVQRDSILNQGIYYKLCDLFDTGIKM